MAVSVVTNQERRVEEYVRTARSLIAELDRAMRAISRNDLAELGNSLADQQTLTCQLVSLQGQILGLSDLHPSTVALDGASSRQLTIVRAELQSLNSVYASVLTLSNHSASLMTSLLDSFKGHFQEASGPRPKYQTWSCQM